MDTKCRENMESNNSDSVNFVIPKPMQKTSTLMKQIDGGGGAWP